MAVAYTIPLSNRKPKVRSSCDIYNDVGQPNFGINPIYLPMEERG